MMTRRMTEMRILDWGQMVSSQWPGSSQYSHELTQVTPQSRAPAAAAVSGMVRGCEAVERKVRMLCDTQGSSLKSRSGSCERATEQPHRKSDVGTGVRRAVEQRPNDRLVGSDLGDLGGRFR